MKSEVPRVFASTSVPWPLHGRWQLASTAAEFGCETVAAGGSTALAQDLLTMCFLPRKHDLIHLSIGILGQQRSLRAIGSYGTTTVADREIAASETIFVFHQMLRPIDKLPSRPARFQHPRKVRFAEHIAKEIFRLTGDPAVALSHGPSGVHRNKLVRAVLFPDTGQTRRPTDEVIN